MYENPSAGKFDPPPDAEEARSQRRRRWQILALSMLTSYPILRWLLPEHVTGWLAWTAVAFAFAVTVARFVLEFKHDDEIRGGPYAQHSNITR
jgi:hypothetical protein